MFEPRYRQDPDPWGTLSDPVELAKADDTLTVCGPGPFRRVCELGAGVGSLTARLAPRCAELLTIDVAPTAVALAAQRLTPWPHARALVGEIPRDLPSGPLDLVVASEILYYLDADGFAATLAWLAGALEPGGRVVSVHWLGAAPDLRRGAADVAAALASLPELARLVAECRRTYRLDVLERV